MTTEIHRGYYSAKLSRQKKERPTEWLIVEINGKFELTHITFTPSREATQRGV